ncbi:peptidase M61 [Lamprobacter modestohalophilus]|uniref:M61 family metallopeptidase n=1 Tax=Lamprobacter modestohalophilus TaxID=1064514 RepID=UPI002ADED61B|nr:PDZ domain-containing protein [Lamprobacter modestohalophilus]MEA1049724.1 peptidase M61 [Lamprobacter modestohalophilus]
MSESNPLLYRVVPARPDAHCFEVMLEIPAPDTETLQVSMPAWIPGSYMIRDFARNLLSVVAQQAGRPVALEKLDKQTWQLSGLSPQAGPVQLSYEVYAWELTVRSAHLDRSHGYYNGTSLFLCVAGAEERPCQVEILPPPGAIGTQWQVATSLARDGAPAWGFGRYRADDYADLIDHPVEMGVFDRIAFKVEGVPHWMTISGRHRADLRRLTLDLPRICAEHAALFGELPIDRYLFLTQLVGDGYGGLEHRFSTSLLANRDDLPAPAWPMAMETDMNMEAKTDREATAMEREATPMQAPSQPSEGYRRFLGLCSHEYFHLWNVKRIRPRAFAEQGLEREVHTRLLWAFEGITSYYDDLALVRSGVIDAKAYLTLLAELITRVQRNPGRLRQSVAESSFDAWTRFYKQDENAPNAIVSYYAKGALTALALDLTIRNGTEHRKSLDDVMRALWQGYGRTSVGIGEREVEQVAAEVSGLDLTGFFDHALDSTDDLDLAPLLRTVAIEMRLRPSTSAKDNGGCVERFEPTSSRPDIGVRLQPDSAEARLGVVLDGRPAQRAGLSAGDLIIAVDGLRANAGNLDALIARAAGVGPIRMHAFRRDELFETEVLPELAPADTCELRLDEEAADAARARRETWLASSVKSVNQA